MNDDEYDVGTVVLRAVSLKAKSLGLIYMHEWLETQVAERLSQVQTDEEQTDER